MGDTRCSVDGCHSFGSDSGSSAGHGCTLLADFASLGALFGAEQLVSVEDLHHLRGDPHVDVSPRCSDTEADLLPVHADRTNRVARRATHTPSPRVGDGRVSIVAQGRCIRQRSKRATSLASPGPGGSQAIHKLARSGRSHVGRTNRRLSRALVGRARPARERRHYQP